MLIDARMDSPDGVFAANNVPPWFFVSHGVGLFSFLAVCGATGLFAYGVGLSLFSFWFICVAPVRGRTYFLCGRKESRQRKRLKPPV
jgi:hypothetical protein